MLERFNLRKRFIITFVLIIVFSVISVILALLLFLYLLNNDIFIRPANFFEKQIPRIENYIEKQNAKILDISYQDKLEAIIPVDGMKYQILDSNAQIQYGNIDKIIIKDKKDLLLNLNNSSYNNGNITKFLPIIDENKDLKGVVILQYILRVSPIPDQKIFFKWIMILLLISPFIFIIIYTALFGKIFSKSINKPLKMIIGASKKIQNNDLDFTLNYPYNNELGQVINSFESMRSTLKETLNRQWKTEQEKKEMISALSHDLRSPLTVIKGHVELLQDGSYKNEQRLFKYLNSIESSTQRAILLVQDLNTLSKIDNADFKLNYSDVSVLDYIKEKIEEYSPLVNKKNIDLIAKPTGINEDYYYKFDKLRISQVLDNIMMNSVRYTPDNGTIILYLSLDYDKLKFKICNSGKIFNDEDLKNIFSKFYRGDKSRSRQGGHSGLGMYISKVIVEKHGGNIKAYNDENKRATIEFFI